MQNQRLEQIAAWPKPLTPDQRLDRLLAAMSAWWDGWSFARIGRAHGISRQRAAVILARVHCTKQLWRSVNRERRIRHATISAHEAEDARRLLLQSAAGRLTASQRAAVAWAALGLSTVEAGRRMKMRPCHVRNLRAWARVRLEIMELSPGRIRRRSKRRQAATRWSIPELDWSRVEWKPLDDPLVAQPSS